MAEFKRLIYPGKLIGEADDAIPLFRLSAIENNDPICYLPSMHHQEFPPPEELKDTIKCFWYNRREVCGQTSGFEVQPDGYVEIIFHFGDILNIVHGGTFEALPSPFLMGLLDQPVTFYADGRLEIIAIRFFPWTVFDLLGLEPGKDGLRIFKHPIASLQPALDKCVKAGKVEEALILVKQYFLDVQLHVEANSMLFKAGVAMRKANGAMPVSGVAAAAHATVRTLERNFKQSSGYTVKDVSALIRFEQVRNRLWHQPGTSLAGLAHALGYTDQSHLSREFKRYSGTTPAAFARKARERLVIGGDFVAFIQA